MVGHDIFISICKERQQCNIHLIQLIFKDHCQDGHSVQHQQDGSGAQHQQDRSGVQHQQDGGGAQHQHQVGDGLDQDLEGAQAAG